MISEHNIKNEEDLQMQNDELQALESIYDSKFNVIDPDNGTYEIHIQSESNYKQTVNLRFTLVPDYPSKCGPTFYISSQNLSRQQQTGLNSTLKILSIESIGSPVIHSMVETIQSFLYKLSASAIEDMLTSEPEKKDSVVSSSMPMVFNVPSVRLHMEAHGNRLPFAVNVQCPTIYHGETITDRKSVFQAHCCRVASLPEVSAFISSLLEDKKIAAATHKITAWYLQAKLDPSRATTSLVADYDDDRETHAGGRLLHLITLAAIEGVAVMVTRWYGGIQLGPDRFKHINNVASQLLMQQNLTKGTQIREKETSKFRKHRQ